MRCQQLSSWHLWSSRAVYRSWTILQSYYVCLHTLDVHIIVEVNYIFSFAIKTRNLHVDIDYAPLTLEHFGVLVDDVVELDLQPVLDLANPIYRAHNHLVKHTID